MSLLCRAMLVSAAWIAGPAASPAAPFAEEIAFRQPDGTHIRLWGEGDEFHAVFETLDGYTVVFDPANRAYHYAKLSADGADLLLTGALVGRIDPSSLGLPKHLRVRADVAGQRARERAREWDREMGVSERWTSLKETRRAARRSAAIAVAADDTGAKAADGPVILAPPASPTLGTKVGLCLLIDFYDDPATVPATNLVELINGDGFTGFGNNGSVKQYYFDNSAGLLLYTNVVTAYIRMVEPKSFYNDTSKSSGLQGRLLLTDALAILKASPNYETEVLPRFDALTVDANGQVIACNVYFAGPTSGVWSYGLWPHSGSLASAIELSPGGKKVRRYQISNIGTTPNIGTFCHENGHMLCSFPDIYDYDQGEEDSRGGAGRFCIMDSSGSYNPVQFCAYLKLAAGWATAVDVTSDSFEAASLSSAGAAFNRFYRFFRPGVDTEYFLLENRQRAGRDATLPAAGIAVWHIDELGDRDNQSLLTNSVHANYEVTLEQADNLWHFQYNINSGDTNDLYYSGNTASGYRNEFSDGTSPAANWWDGTPSGAVFSDFGESGEVMTFQVGGGIAVAPDGPVAFAGLPGGPFEPEVRVLVVTNRTAHSIDWVAATGQGWLDLSPASGALSPGSAIPVTVTPNAAALALSRGLYEDDLSISNLTTGQVVLRDVRLELDIAIDWINAGAGLWQEPGNWGPARAPADSLWRVSITNATSKTVVVDATTSSGAAGTMTISNLLLAAPPGDTNRLHLASPGTNVPLTILNDLTLGPGGQILISNAILCVEGASGGNLSVDGEIDVATNGALRAVNNSVLTSIGLKGNGLLRVDGGFVDLHRLTLGRNPGATGTVAVTGGAVTVATNGVTYAGSNGVGRIELSGGQIWCGSGLVAGYRAGSLGTIEISGGQLRSSYLQLGNLAGATGSLLLDGGELLATNLTSPIGRFGKGDLVISNGVARFAGLFLGDDAGSKGSLNVAGGLCSSRGACVGYKADATGHVEVTSGSYVATNGTTYLGWLGCGDLRISGGAARLSRLYVGYSNFARGSLDVCGGTGIVAGTMYLGSANSAVGVVRVSDGELVATNLSTHVGYGSLGMLSLTGGTLRLGTCWVGYRAGPGGMITVDDGTAIFNSSVILGSQPGSTGLLQINGGMVSAINGGVIIGQFGRGSMILSNGTLHTQALDLGGGAGASGDFVAEGGLTRVSSSVTLGNCGTGANGNLCVSGADVFVTNAAHDGTLYAHAGTLTVEAGSLTVDRLVVTGACARVVLLGGALNLNSPPLLGTGMDADGDGLPNEWEQAWALDPLVTAGEHGPAGDPDRDGYSNSAEYLAGCEPRNGRSFPCVSAVSFSGGDVVVVIQSVAGRHYQLQAGPLSASDDWTDIGGPVAGTGGPLQLVDPGGASHPARFYRVKIAP